MPNTESEAQTSIPLEILVSILKKGKFNFLGTCQQTFLKYVTDKVTLQKCKQRAVIFFKRTALNSKKYQVTTAVF